MARLAYYAPGVYVEQVPSARQPIAGVGTNTVGFIGIVPNEIYCPVPNPDYDPVLARNLLEYNSILSPVTGVEPEDERTKEDEAAARTRLEEAQSLIVAQIQQVQDEKDELARQIAELKPKAEADLEPLTAAVRSAEEALRGKEGDQKEAAKKALEDAQDKLASATSERTKARRDLVRQNAALESANSKFASLKASLEELERTLEVGDGAGPPNGSRGSDIDEYSPPAVPPETLLIASKFHPYYFKKFTVKAEPFATKLCTNFSEYTNIFGDFSAFEVDPANPNDNPSKWKFRPRYLGHHLLTHAVNGFFKNGGTRCFVARVRDTTQLRDVLTRFESIDDVAILAAPGLPKTKDVWEELQTYCEDDSHQNVFAILDPSSDVGDEQGGFEITRLQDGANSQETLPRRSSYAALYFPDVEVQCPAKALQDSDPARRVEVKYRGRTYVAPSGHIAGIYARTDEERGVHKAPANATVRGAIEVKYYISRAKQEGLNPQGVNCIRLMDGNVTVWGARTVGGDSNGEFKYVNVRRFMGFLEESIDEGTQWVVFEPNDPSLWSKIILNITAFLTNVWRNGALFGLTPQEAFYVKCDAELNPPEVRDLGQVITEIGVAIVRPAEFVIFRITQSTGLQQG